MASADDPLETVATRGLMSHKFGHCAFYYHYEEKVITIDLSLGIKSDKYGKFNASKLGKLDLGLIIPRRKKRCNVFCTIRWCHVLCTTLTSYVPDFECESIQFVAFEHGKLIKPGSYI